MEEFSLCILVVDDDQDSCQALKTLIEQGGQEALQAYDSRAGLAKALALRPDVVIIQSTLPASGGIDLVRQLRAGPEDYHPCIILAAWPEERLEMQEALEAGVDEFIDMPLKPEVVAAQLRVWHRLASLQRENERFARKLQQYSTELTCSNLRLRELAITDDLTGLPNRRYSMELLQHEWAIAHRDNSALSCMVIDLNGLKQINEEQGLERGDVVLKTIAAIMRTYLPAEDTVCRISGDEFLAICPGTPLSSVIARGEKLVGLVRSFNIHAESYPLGLSIGVAECRPGIDSPQELITLAEHAMHEAKRAGRNLIYADRGADRRSSRRAANGAQTGKSGRRKAKKQFSLWRPADVLDVIAAGA